MPLDIKQVLGERSLIGNLLKPSQVNTTEQRQQQTAQVLKVDVGCVA